MILLILGKESDEKFGAVKYWKGLQLPVFNVLIYCW